MSVQSVQIFGAAYFLLAASQYGMILAMLQRFCRGMHAFEARDPGSLPGVSILVPVKGVLPTFESNLRSLLSQSYSGPFEIVLGVRDENDPVLAVAKRISAELASGPRVVFAVGGADGGLNPKNSNLARAFRQASHDWIYCSDADVRLTPDHLLRCMMATGAKPDHFATSMTINEGGRSLGARLECIGSNLEASMFFLGALIRRPNESMNGASMFFHRNLLAKAGGFDISLDRLTDDLLLGRELTRAGGQGELVPGVVRETLESQSLQAFQARFVRWILIAKCFRPELFWIGPLFWTWQWLVVLGIVLREPALLAFAAASFAARALTSATIQLRLGAPVSDLLNIPALALYDCIAPIAWFRALFERRVVWAGKTLSLQKNGVLIQ